MRADAEGVQRTLQAKPVILGQNSFPCHKINEGCEMKAFFKIGIASVLLAALCACNVSPVARGTTAAPVAAQSTTQKVVEKSGEVRAVWITYQDMGKFYKETPKKSDYEKNIKKRIAELKAFGINRLIVHIRAFSDAFYKSDIFPWSAYLTGTQGKDPGFDPLAIWVEQAHAQKMEIEGWLNPYRISADSNWDKLAPTNPAVKWHSDQDKTNDSWVAALPKGGLYYNPAVAQVQGLILSGIKEILENYDVDGIHFDDYFYPSTDASVDAVEFKAYGQGGGKLSLAQWRRENVNTLISSVYRLVKKTKPSVRFGISPMASIQKNYDTQYADVTLWATKEGYADYLCPQVYFGFRNEPSPFMSMVKAWESLGEKGKVDLYVGLPLYKSGKVDDYASPKNKEPGGPCYEFKEETNIMARQVRYLRQTRNIEGFYIYAYDQMFGAGQNEQSKKEMANLKKELS